MYKTQVEYSGYMHEYEMPSLIETFSFNSKREALEKYKILLATYLARYGILWDNISKKEHKKEFLSKSLDELKAMEFEAFSNKELDYKISFMECD